MKKKFATSFLIGALVILSAASAEALDCAIINHSSYKGCYDLRIGTVETNTCYQTIRDISLAFEAEIKSGNCSPSQEQCYIQNSIFPDLFQIQIGRTLLDGGESIGSRQEIEYRVRHLQAAKACK